MKPIFASAGLVLALGVAGCASGPVTQAQAPAGPRMMVSSANPMATDAGLAVLERGGTAVDAAVAVQAVLGLVEPQSSGLGGGAFMTYYDAKTRKVTAYNGRETAPAGATPTMFLDETTGQPLSPRDAVLSGRSTGVPGAVAMLYMAQKDHGKLAWKDLFDDAERLARDGFPMPGRMAAAANRTGGTASTPDSNAYFTKPDGTRPQAGEMWKNPAYAVTVRKIAMEGPDAILKGPLAQAIVDKLHEGPRPGSMTLEDLASYKPKSGPALCKPYRVYIVCVPPAPSGGPAVLEGLGILQNTAIDKTKPTDAEGWSLFAQASRLMYADRDRYMGDPDFVDVPTEGLLEPTYLAARAKLIGTNAGPAPQPGTPRGAGIRAPDATKEVAGTTHFSVVDAQGNAVSMTTTVEGGFGSGRMVGGFYLNNQLTDFSYSPKNPDGVDAANAVAGSKRPRSSMAPAIVLDRQNRLVASVGSPGGTSILGYNLKALVGLLDWKLPVQDAINLPNVVARGDTYGAEVDKFPPAVVQALAQRNIKLTSGGGAEGSGLHGIEVTPEGLRGGADPRREGVARGR